MLVRVLTQKQLFEKLDKGGWVLWELTDEVSWLCSEFRGVAFSENITWKSKIVLSCKHTKVSLPSSATWLCTSRLCDQRHKLSSQPSYWCFQDQLLSLCNFPSITMSFTLSQTEGGMFHPEISSWLTWPLLFNALSHRFLLVLSKEWFTTVASTTDKTDIVSVCKRLRSKHIWQERPMFSGERMSKRVISHRGFCSEIVPGASEQDLDLRLPVRRAGEAEAL